MLWPKQSPRRGGTRRRQRPWVGPLVASALSLAAAVACCRRAYFPDIPTYRTPDCRVIATCAQTLPVCGPDVNTPVNDYPVWYWGRQQPRNSAALLGFQPLLPTRVVGRASWDSAMLVVKQTEHDAPLLREVYARWPPVFHPADFAPGVTPPTPAPARPSYDVIYLLDETTAVLGPLTHVDSGGGGGMRIVTRRDVALGAATGTLYYLAPTAYTPPPSPTPISPAPTPSAVSEDTYSWLVLIWNVGPVTLRMIAATWEVGFAVRVSDDPASPGLEIASQTHRPFPPDTVESELLQMAATVQPYAGCEQSSG
jgi:hypothetical protein